MEVLSEREQEQVIRATLRGSGSPLSEQALARALRWASEARVGAALLAQVLSGDVVLAMEASGGPSPSSCEPPAFHLLRNVE